MFQNALSSKIPLAQQTGNRNNITEVLEVGHVTAVLRFRVFLVFFGLGISGLWFYSFRVWDLGLPRFFNSTAQSRLLFAVLGFETSSLPNPF